MREAVLYEKISGSRVRCNICQWRCVIAPEKDGVCRMRRNDDGVLHTSNYAISSSVNIDSIEKKPLFHFYPASLAFSIGTWGCNFHCRGCQNWQIACTDTSFLEESRAVEADELIRMAKSGNCRGIAYTYNEPTIWFEYTLDCAKLARENGLYNVYVTNGFMTEEALDMIGPYLDGYCVDVKGFSDEFYRDMAKISNWRGILDVTERAKRKWGMHVEVVTNIVPGMNDDDGQLGALAVWIRDSLGDLTPWHVTRFYPRYQMEDLPATPVSSLERAYDIGKKAGLRFVYAGNVPGHAYENTVCYSCGNLIISRLGYNIEIVGLEGSRCRFCGAELNMLVGEVSHA
ncbi:MAG: AmmeMemoRadiSam system radical SAM enzyme [Chloroflexota bacterium]|nr:AmmeMemoRadiSam system radical SAM enzyme [Chloroflexota bacterium]